MKVTFKVPEFFLWARDYEVVPTELTLFTTIPTQYLSADQAFYMNKMSESLQNVGFTNILIVITVQFFAKKVLSLSQPLIFFLQIVMLTRNFKGFNEPQPA